MVTLPGSLTTMDKQGDYTTMRNGRGIARRVLLINTAVAVFAFVAQVSSLAVYGPSHDYWQLYLILMVLMLVSSLAAQSVVEKWSVFAGMNFYAWVCFACVAGMVCIDGMFLRTEFPMILFVLTLGVLGLSLTVGYVGAVPYAAVCAILILTIGLWYNAMDSAIIGVVLLTATGTMASEGGHTVKRLDELEVNLGAYVNAKRESAGLDKATHRGDESRGES